AGRVEHGGDHWMTPQLPLGGEARAARGVAEQHEDVEVALVVRGEDEGSAGRQVLAALDAHAHAEHSCERPCAGLGEAPGELPVAREAVESDGDRPHPDQHAAEEERRERGPQAAALAPPALLHCRTYW